MLKKLLGKSLAYRLTLLMTLVVIITLGIVIFLYIYLEKGFAYNTAEYQFHLMDRTFDELISYTNGKDHDIQPQYIIEKLGENSNINYITLYTNNGKPLMASITSSQKSLSEKELKELEELSHDDSITTMSKKTLDYIAPIRLRSSCEQCHTNGKTLGFIKISSYYATIYKHTYDMAKKLGLIFLSSLFIFWIAAIFISEFVVVKPLKEFVALIHKAELNNFLPRGTLTRQDEIGEIEDNFNQMLSRITKLMATSVEKERELVFVKEELKYKELLEKRSEQIEKVNKELEDSVKELSTMYNFGQYIISTVDMNELLRIITTAIVDTLNYKECAILFKENNLLRIVSAWGFEDNAKLIGIEFGLDEGISGNVASSGKPLLINDTSKESRYLHYKGHTHKEGSFLSIPLKYKNSVIGVLNVSNDTPNSLTKKDIDFLTAISAQIAVVIENARLYEQTKELSITDDLTGLFNRRHMRVVLDKEWERSNRYSQPLSILMIDLDLFKSYNDNFGHLKGDEALAILSQIIKMNIRGIDAPIRYGGDEFLIILPDTDADGAMATAEKLRKAIADAFTYKNVSTLTISIGVVTYPNEMFDNIHEFLYASDIALYEAKKRGQNTIAKYDSKSMQEKPK
jgi:diguanylate cyclase (GGDEF)-like protein